MGSGLCSSHVQHQRRLCLSMARVSIGYASRSEILKARGEDAGSIVTLLGAVIGRQRS